MPQLTCVQCATNDTLLWRRGENGKICYECHLDNKKNIKTEPYESNEDESRDDDDDMLDEETTPAMATGRGVRKSTRSTRYKSRTPARMTPMPSAPHGRGRRSIFKRPPLKAPTATATVVTSDSIYFRGMYMQAGDIVSMINHDGGTYYAQIQRFLTDQYCEKSAVVTWLIPTRASPPPEERFDPATYIIGPAEVLPRKLECMEFIMHAPIDYFKAHNSPYQLVDTELNNYTGFVWQTLEPKDRI